jgi:uncharacterized membrane protein
MNKSGASFGLLGWIKNNYLTLIIIFLSFYLLLAFLAPMLMHAGYPGVAKIIYRGYSNLCHQYAYRSWFLFGSQAHYPLEAADGQLSVYDVFDLPIDNPEISREIIGNAETGYKVALCQRDVALYGSVLIFALIFFFRRNHIQKIPFIVWIVLAVIPIGIDGMWQLAGTYGLLSSSYESSPLMRSITGVMFGFFSGWLLFPAIEQSIKKDGLPE